MAFIALGIPGLVMGVIVYLTVREPRARPARCRSRGHQAVARRVAAIPVAAEGGLSRGHRRRAVRAVGMGTHLLDADLPAARLQSQCGPGGCRDRQHSSDRRLARDARDGVDTVAAVRWPIRGAWCGCWPAGDRVRHHSVDHRLLDALARDCARRCSGSSFRRSISTSARASAC